MSSKVDIALAIVEDIAAALIIGIVIASLVISGLLSPAAASIIGAIAAVIYTFIAYKTTKALLMKPMAGEGIIGKRGLTVIELKPEGMALIEGEYWSVKSSEPIEKGALVEVVKAEGLKATVVRVDEA